MQNESGRKKILTKVRSLTFSPSRVDARLSITPLALKSYWKLFGLPQRIQEGGWDERVLEAPPGHERGMDFTYPISERNSLLFQRTESGLDTPQFIETLNRRLFIQQSCKM